MFLPVPQINSRLCSRLISTSCCGCLAPNVQTSCRILDQQPRWAGKLKSLICDTDIYFCRLKHQVLTRLSARMRASHYSTSVVLDRARAGFDSPVGNIFLTILHGYLLQLRNRLHSCFFFLYKDVPATTPVMNLFVYLIAALQLLYRQSIRGRLRIPVDQARDRLGFLISVSRPVLMNAQNYHQLTHTTLYTIKYTLWMRITRH